MSGFGANDKILDWLDRARSHPDARFRTVAVRELGARKTSADAVASATLADPDPGVRRAAAEALRWYEDGPWFAAVEEALSAPTTETREAAAQALAAISDRRAIGPLARALRDDHEKVRLAAAESLIALSVETARNIAVDTLLTLAKSSDEECRARAGVALLHLLPDPGVQIPGGILEKIVVSPRCRPNDREQAFDALGGYDWPPFAKVLDFPSNGDPKVVEAMVSRLLVTPDEDAPPDFERLARFVRGLARAAQGELDEALTDVSVSNSAYFHPEATAWLAEKLEDIGRRSDAMYLLTDAVSSLRYLRDYVDNQDWWLEQEAALRLRLGWLAYLDSDRDTAFSESDAAAKLTGGEVSILAMFNLALAQLVFDSTATALTTYAAAFERCGGLDADDANKVIALALQDLEGAEGQAPHDAIDAARALLVRDV